MADLLSENKETTFGRDLMKFVSSRLPYTGYNILDRITDLNPKYKIFYDKGAKSQENLINKSITSSIQYDEPAANILMNKEFYEYMYANIQPDKGKRLQEYRVMAAFSEVSDALDEICDELINVDRDGNIVQLNFNEPNKLDGKLQEQWRKEFKRYIGYYELNKKGWEYFRQVLVDGLLSKDIETYGIIKVTQKGLDFIKKPSSFMMSEDHEYNESEDEAIVTAAKSSGTADEALMSMLRDLRKKVAKKLCVPTFVVFQDPSLEDMALKYPISMDELINTHGVGEGKAKKYGK